MTTRTRSLTKVLRYHLPLAVNDPEGAMQSMADHWRGFSWRCGPYIVKWFSDSWPELQVWAESEAEGKRVIRHALDHIGATEDEGEWYSSYVDNKRNGKIGTVSPTLVSASPTSKGVRPHLPVL
jgi:hypothetical protein